MSTIGYFAVPDPDDPRRMTYWRRHESVRYVAHPAGARYEPVPPESVVPSWEPRYYRERLTSRWMQENHPNWRSRVYAEIDADPWGCAARYVLETSRCSDCGMKLRDPVSKAYGVGPVCRERWSPELLAVMEERVRGELGMRERRNQ